MIIINSNSLKVETKRLYEFSIRSIVNHPGCAFQIEALLLQARLKSPSPSPYGDPPRRRMLQGVIIINSNSLKEETKKHYITDCRCWWAQDETPRHKYKRSVFAAP